VGSVAYHATTYCPARVGSAVVRAVGATLANQYSEQDRLVRSKGDLLGRAGAAQTTMEI
jgi:hypothetical protein